MHAEKFIEPFIDFVERILTHQNISIASASLEG